MKNNSTTLSSVQQSTCTDVQPLNACNNSYGFAFIYGKYPRALYSPLYQTVSRIIGGENDDVKALALPKKDVAVFPIIFPNGIVPVEPRRYTKNRFGEIDGILVQNNQGLVGLDPVVLDHLPALRLLAKQLTERQHRHLQGIFIRTKGVK